jgi:hypothetical protein
MVVFSSEGEKRLWDCEVCSARWIALAVAESIFVKVVRQISKLLGHPLPSLMLLLCDFTLRCEAGFMRTDSLIVTFPGASTAEGNRLAGTLADALRDVDPTIVAQRKRERPDTQDFGASLAVVLGTAAVTAVAKGIAAWLSRNSGARVEIRSKGEVVLVASGLDSKDVPRIAEALSGRA